MSITILITAVIRAVICSCKLPSCLKLHKQRACYNSDNIQRAKIMPAFTRIIVVWLTSFVYYIVVEYFDIVYR